MMKGYKAFDENFKCMGFKYEVGKTYETSEEIFLCNSGFHFCKKIKDVLQYYPITSRFAEIKAIGKIVNSDDKSVTNKITIVKELTRDELIKLFKCKNNNLGYRNTGDRNTGDSNTGNWNTGDWNTGDRNTGDRNTGDRNTGNWNTGDWNTGDWNTGYSNTGNWNTGDWNTGYSNTGNRNTGNWNTGDRNTGNWNTGNWNKCDYETGYFNSKQSDIIRVFNKEVSREVWEKCTKPNFIYNVISNVWIDLSDMSEEEKRQNPNAYVQDGYLKSISMKEAWKIAFKNATDKDIKLLKELPNYDYEVFSEITGLTDERLK